MIYSQQLEVAKIYAYKVYSSHWRKCKDPMELTNLRWKLLDVIGICYRNRVGKTYLNHFIRLERKISKRIEKLSR